MSKRKATVMLSGGERTTIDVDEFERFKEAHNFAIPSDSLMDQFISLKELQERNPKLQIQGLTNILPSTPPPQKISNPAIKKLRDFTFLTRQYRDSHNSAVDEPWRVAMLDDFNDHLNYLTTDDLYLLWKAFGKFRPCAKPSDTISPELLDNNEWNK